MDQLFGMRAPTHESLDPESIFALAGALTAEGARISEAGLLAFAKRQGASPLHAWVALAYSPEVAIERTHDIAFGVCLGRCQLWGALPVLEALLALREERLAAGKAGFDVVPRGCLSRCEHGAFVVGVTPAGQFGMGQATPEQVTAAVAHAFGEAPPEG